MEIKEIVNRIKFIRDRARLSARELSLRIDKNEHYINRLEVNQNFSPTIKTLNEIIIACGSSIDEFFYYDITKFQQDKLIIESLKKASAEKRELALKILTIE